MSPWLDFRFPPNDVKLAAMEAQTHRRFIKTHLTVEALVYSPKAKYIYIGRDGRDVLWSLYNHHSMASEVMYNILNNTPGLVGPPLEPPTADIRHLPNILLVHFDALKKDMPGEIRRIAKHLDITINEKLLPGILERISFKGMKENFDAIMPEATQLWREGANTFMNKGVNGRWQGVLTDAELDQCRAAVARELTPDCADWLEHGGVHRVKP